LGPQDTDGRKIKKKEKEKYTRHHSKQKKREKYKRHDNTENIKR